MPDDTQPTEPAQPTEQPPVEAPAWASELTQTIRDLPGKLKASISDDDKSGIAEAVHGLFERSGAFEREAEQQQQQNEQTTEVTTDPNAAEETAPKKTGLAGFAAWFEGSK